MKIEAVKGNIINQSDLDVVVNAADSGLSFGGGVAKAIYEGAGKEIKKEGKKKCPIAVGGCIITRGYNLPNKWVIHCVGPRYGIDEPERKLLKRCYKSALKLAEKYNIDSIGFPAISAGIFGYPTKEAAQIAIEAVNELNADVKLVRFVLFDDETFNIFEKLI